jgi:N-acetylneuraminic acid mutarotase
MPGRRWQHAMVALDGVMYVIGGIVDGAADHTAVWAYDIATDTWRTDLAPLPTARDHLAAVTADGAIVVLAGRTGRNLPTVEIYDPATDTWTSGPDMGTPRGGFAAAVLADGIHVTGGEEFVTDRTIGSHEVLDLASMTWSDAADLPTPRHGIASAVVDGRWYVIAGGRDVGLATSDIVEVWEP